MKETMCFAYKNGRCKILTVKKCEGEQCSFLKTASQVEEDKKNVFRRIKSLDEATRKHIMELYYEGKMSLLDDVEVG